MNLLGCSRLKKLHVIGLGTAGTNMAVHLKRNGIVGKYTCITRFPSFIEPLELANYIKGFYHIEYDYRLEFAINYDSLAKNQSKPLTIEMQQLLSDNCFYIILVGLGGYTGTSLIKSTLEFIQSNHKQYMSVCQLPFEFDGEHRNNLALVKKAEIEKFEGVHFIDHPDFQDKTSIKKFFNIADEKTYSFVKTELPQLIS